MARKSTNSSVKHFVVRLAIKDLQFAVPLICKRATLGDIEVLHAWIDVRELYGQRGKGLRTCNLLTDHFWMKCVETGTFGDPAIQELYLLATLCPYVRGNAANRLLPGARLHRSSRGKDSWKEAVELLETLLKTPPNEAERKKGPMTRLRFYLETRDMLFPEIDPKLRQEYEEIRGELFTDDVRKLLMATPRADEEVKQKWNTLKARYGRHSKYPRKRQVLDIVSYEAMAALRRCYATLWYDLLPKLAELGFPNQSLHFLHFIHLEHLLDATDTTSSLMHGHIFALHPAMSLLLATKAGPKLFGEYVKQNTAEEKEQPLNDLLAAIFASLCVYAGARDIERDRKRNPLTNGSRNYGRHRERRLREEEHRQAEERENNLDGLDPNLGA